MTWKLLRLRLARHTRTHLKFYMEKEHCLVKNSFGTLQKYQFLHISLSLSHFFVKRRQVAKKEAPFCDNISSLLWPLGNLCRYSQSSSRDTARKTQ